MKMYNLIEALNDIPDEYIDAYYKKTGMNSRLKFFLQTTACLLIILILGIPIYHGINKTQMEDLFMKNNLKASLRSEDEAFNLVYNHLAIKNLYGSDYESLILKVYYQQEGELFNQEDWRYVKISEDYLEGDLSITCYLDGSTVEEVKNDMIFKEENTLVTSIRNHMIWQATYVSVSYDAMYCAVFELDGITYDVRFSSNDKSGMEQILDKLIP